MALSDAVAYATAQWTLDESSSGTRADSVGSDDLTDNNTVGSAAGKFSNCAQFVSANSESLSVLHSSANSPGNSDFTVSFWLKLTSKSASQMLVYKSSGGSGEYAIGYGSGSDRLYVQVFGSINFGTLTQVVANNFGSPPTDTWMLVVVTHDATADVVSISVDGGTADTGSHTAGIYQPGVGTLRIGADNFSSGYADVCIDDLTILIGYALDSTETSELYNSGTGVAFADWPGGGGGGSRLFSGLLGVGI